MTGTGSGRSMPTRRSSTIRSLRTPMSASIARRPAQRSPTATGRRQPVTTSAPVASRADTTERDRQRAEGEREREDGLGEGEHPRERPVGDQPLEQREPGDVDDGVGGADDRERADRHGVARHQADEDERHAPHRDPGAEQRAQPGAAGGADRRHRRREPADPERRPEQPDPRAAQVGHLHGHHHREHGERAADQALGPPRTITSSARGRRRSSRTPSTTSATTPARAAGASRPGRSDS